MRGIWWWTIGKIWSETSLLPHLLGVVTMALAVLAFVAAAAAAPLGMSASTLWLAERTILGLWTFAVAIALWRTR